MNEALSDEARPLIEHLRELKRRVTISVIIWVIALFGCYYFVEQIYSFLLQPLAAGFPEGASRRLIYTSPPETFFTYMKLASYSALFVAFPVIASQFYLFLAPGLYKNERRVLGPYLLISPLLFFAGAALLYYYILPLAMGFFISFENAEMAAGMPLELETKVSEYLSLVIQLTFAFGLAFQLPVVLTLMARVGMLKAETLAKGRKYAVVIMITVAALITPPDIISQIGLFFPLYLLYECSILTCRIMEKKAEDA
jgi:sec-independent protein translocase protein TatC